MMKMEEPAYRKFYHCHTCGKTLQTEYVEAHKALGHKVETYLTLPNTPKYENKIHPKTT